VAVPEKRGGGRIVRIVLQLGSIGSQGGFTE